MARKDSDHQKKSMSALFRGRAIFKPLNTGWIDTGVACVREWVANIFFYTKNGTTIMIDAGYNYARLKEKMGWLDINPALIRHILITHQDTDHVGALETDSEQLDGIKVECILVPGHTWGHMVYLIDDTWLFTGDTIWFGADGGYSFISTLAENNHLAVQSLEKLEKNIRARNHPIAVVTGHTGWTDDLDFVFRHRAEICRPFTRHYSDPEAPYDGYVEDDDTEDKARTVRLARKNPA